MHVRAKDAAAQLSVSVDTLRRWDKLGWIRTARTDGNQRLYDVEDYKARHPDQYGKEAHRTTKAKAKSPEKVIYCRVSSNKQKDDLQRQANRLQAAYPEHEVCTEIGSGINFKRKVLYRLLERALAGTLKEIVVSHRDRLCRFAWDHFEWLFTKLGVRLVVFSEDDQDLSGAEQLSDDLMSIIHVFSSRHYGSRARKNASAACPNKTQGSPKDRKHECQESGTRPEHTSVQPNIQDNPQVSDNPSVPVQCPSQGDE